LHFDVYRNHAMRRQLDHVDRRGQSDEAQRIIIPDHKTGQNQLAE
jgi:hypothetical protein